MYKFKDEDITSELKNEILSLYKQKNTIEAIARNEKMFYKDVVFILQKKGFPLNVLKPDIPNMKIDSNSAIFSADYHFGSIKENLDYVKLLYDYAVKNNINDIYILGNLFHGNNSYVTYDMKNPEDQVEHVIESFPFDENIKLHILFGNRDYEVLSRYSEGIDILREREDFDLLGFQSTYVLWQDQYLTLYHNINKYNINVPKHGNNLLNIRGDNYGFEIRDNNVICLPPMCDLVLGKSKTQLSGLPNVGFIEAKISDDELNVSSCEIGFRKVVKHESVIKRELKKK
ncbi:MAG: hypothetical protein J1F35_05275 [Erysipelotrichales bacterium]|nr:hypothetical protein [Erysipelotrichales bacterium]